MRLPVMLLATYGRSSIVDRRELGPPAVDVTRGRDHELLRPELN